MARELFFVSARTNKRHHHLLRGVRDSALSLSAARGPNLSVVALSPAPGRVPEVALDLHVAAPLACAVACAGGHLMLSADGVTS